MSKRDEILPLFPLRIRELLAAADIDFAALREIRLRVNQPLMLRSGARGEKCLYQKTSDPASETPYLVTPQDVRDTMELISRHSLYAFEEDVKRGFLTVPGGHRIGIAGRVVMDGGRVAALRNISFLNIRVSHQVPGCAEAFLPFICGHYEGEETFDICHTLILSGPGGGKTTLLRDIVRLLSYAGKNVSVIDERSEIAGCYQGVPENDLGPRTDVLDGCPKSVGCRMALRSLAPDVLAVDEPGGREDFEALAEVMACGCRIIATMHANGIEDLQAKSFYRELWERKTFERFLVRDPAVPVGKKKAWRVADKNGVWTGRASEGGW